MFDSNKTATAFQPKTVRYLVIQLQQAAGAAATRCARGQDPQPELQHAIAPLASSMPAVPAPHLVDVLLEAVSDRQACTGGPAAAAAGAGAPRRPGARAARIRSPSCSARSRRWPAACRPRRRRTWSTSCLKR